MMFSVPFHADGQNGTWHAQDPTVLQLYITNVYKAMGYSSYPWEFSNAEAMYVSNLLSEPGQMHMQHPVCTCSEHTGLDGLTPAVLTSALTVYSNHVSLGSVVWICL
jgi:hypothetical protein